MVRQRKSKPARKPNENNEPTTTADNNEANIEIIKPPPQSSVASQKPSLNRKNAGANWKNVLATVNPTADGDNPKQLASEGGEGNNNNNNNTDAVQVAPKKSGNRRRRTQRRFVAMDCEMVGTGPMGADDMLARVSIVSRNGNVLLDKFVKPREKVTDYRTSISGIRAHDIEHAEEFDKVQDEVFELLQGKILIGHAIGNDLAVLFIKHPYAKIRDTARYKPLARLVSNGQTPSLKRLSQAILGIEIQKGEHNSVEDARAAMSIYNRLSADWEEYIRNKKRSR